MTDFTIERAVETAARAYCNDDRMLGGKCEFPACGCYRSGQAMRAAIVAFLRERASHWQKEGNTPAMAFCQTEAALVERAGNTDPSVTRGGGGDGDADGDAAKR